MFLLKSCFDIFDEFRERSVFWLEFRVGIVFFWWESWFLVMIGEVTMALFSENEGFSCNIRTATQCFNTSYCHLIYKELSQQNASSPWVDYPVLNFTHVSFSFFNKFRDFNRSRSRWIWFWRKIHPRWQHRMFHSTIP